MADLSLFGPAEFQEETPLEKVSPGGMTFDPEADIKDIVPAVAPNLDALGGNDLSTLSADTAPNPLINSRELTHGMDSAKTAKVLSLSRDSGLPPRVVEQHLDEMERRRTIPDEKLDLIQNQYPQTAQLLSDSDFFAVAQDDIDRMMALEGTIRQYNPGVWERLGAKWEDSRQQLEDGIRGFALGALSSYVQLADAEEAGGFVPNSGVKALRELARGALTHVRAKHEAEVSKRTADLLPADNMIQQYVEDFVGASAPILATIGISAFGSPVAGAAFMGTQIAGGDYLSRKEQGVSDVAAFGSGLADAALQAPLEALSLGKFFNIFKATGGAQILKTVATALGTEFTTEFLQKFPEDLTEDLALVDVRGQDVWDALGGFMDNLDETAKAGLYEGLLSAPWALLGGAGQVVRDYSNMRATEQEQTILDSLTQDITQTNLAQLDPVLHQQALQILASGSQIENVFIDSQAFEAAYGQDVAGQTQVLNSLGISQEAYQNAVATGEELTVQLGNYASTVAAFPEFANNLANDRKLSKQGLTRNEWMQTQQELAKTYQDILIQSQEEVQAATQEDAETKAIFEQVYAARQAAGRVPDAARLDAAQFTAALVSMAKMSEGKYTATQLFEAYMPQVTAGQARVEEAAGIEEPLFQLRTKPAPQKTVKAYKLFRVDPRQPGKLFPLFVDANTPVEMGQWLDAEVGEMAKDGKKVKSKIGPLAFRPGWHAGDLPIATHIGLKANPNDKAPSFRNPDHVWAEIEMAADVDWQEEANRRARVTKAGTIDAKTAHITDQLPEDGFYRYKTNSNMTGSWLIGGSMKVNRILTDDEVRQINEAAGTSDLPRTAPFDAARYGFGQPQAPIDPFDIAGDWATQELELEEGTATAGEVIQALKARAAELQKLVECLK
jgi:hypothetical protein